MEWQFIVALVIAIPIILFPAAFVWYLNIGGIYASVKEAWTRRAARKKEEKETKVVSEVRGCVTIERREYTNEGKPR